jgi:hypothetical protein
VSPFITTTSFATMCKGGTWFFDLDQKIKAPPQPPTLAKSDPQDTSPSFVQEGPAVKMRMLEESIKMIGLLKKMSLIYRLNGWWPILSNLHARIHEQWKPLIYK